MATNRERVTKFWRWSHCQKSCQSGLKESVTVHDLKQHLDPKGRKAAQPHRCGQGRDGKGSPPGGRPRGHREQGAGSSSEGAQIEERFLHLGEVTCTASTQRDSELPRAVPAASLPALPLLKEHVCGLFCPCSSPEYQVCGWVARPTITNTRLGGLNSRNLLSHSSGGWKSKIKVSAGFVSPEASLLGL